MVKRITALKARQNLGQLMNEVAIKEDDYIVERAGKPLVAVISIDKYRHLEEKRGKTETKQQLAVAAKALLQDYSTDKELTIFTSLDSEEIHA